MTKEEWLALDKIVVESISPLFLASAKRGLRPVILRQKRDRLAAAYSEAELCAILYSKRAEVEKNNRLATLYADLAEMWQGTAEVIAMKFWRVSEEIADDLQKQIGTTRTAVLLGSVRHGQNAG